jgi:hypothetical protein
MKSLNPIQTVSYKRHESKMGIWIANHLHTRDS